MGNTAVRERVFFKLSPLIVPLGDVEVSTGSGRMSYLDLDRAPVAPDVVKRNTHH